MASWHPLPARPEDGSRPHRPEDPNVTKASAESRTARGWDVAVVAAIVAVVLFGWFIAGGGNAAGAPRPAPSVAHACPSLSVTPGARARCTRG